MLGHALGKLFLANVLVLIALFSLGPGIPRPSVNRVLFLRGI